MNGSGIFSEDYAGVFYCATCEDEYTLDGTTDDWGSVAYATCLECGTELEKDISVESSIDDDTAYEAYKDSLLD